MCPFHLLLACLFTLLDPSATPQQKQLSPTKVAIKATAATGLYVYLRSMKIKVKDLEKRLKKAEEHIF